MPSKLTSTAATSGMSAAIGWRRRQLVLRVGPGLLGVGERRPGGRVLRRLGLAERADVGGEGLVEPQVVPPPHGHEVAEPHVRELVQHRLGAPLVLGPADLRPEDVVLQEGDRPGVLHGPGVELRHEQLVVLVERVRVVEDLVEEVEALLGDAEELVGVEELRQRRPAVEPQRDALVGVGDLGVRPGDQRHEVGRDALGRLRSGPAASRPARPRSRGRRCSRRPASRTARPRAA